MKNFYLVSTLLLILIGCKYFQKPDGKLLGNIVYNKDDKDVPDAGAEINVILKSDFDSAKASFISIFSRNVHSYDMIKDKEELINFLTNELQYSSSAYQIESNNRTIERSKATIDSENQSILRMDNVDASSLKKWDTPIRQYIDELKKMPLTKSTVADAKGNYSINLPQGRYYVLIKSKHLNGYNNCDFDGMFTLDEQFIMSSHETTDGAHFVLIPSSRSVEIFKK